MSFEIFKQWATKNINTLTLTCIVRELTPEQQHDHQVLCKRFIKDC